MNLSRPGRPTLHDVAILAEVSAKTVSRVVNAESGVSPGTFRRVTEAIDRLGFRPNESARHLRKGSGTNIGLMLADAADPFYAVLTRAVEEVAFHHEYTILASSCAEDPKRAQAIVESFAGLGVKGIIAAPATGMRTAGLQAESRAGCAIVLVDRPLDGFDTDTVLSGNRTGAAEGTRHLIRHGHKRIAYFGDADSIYTATQRRLGYLSALVDAGLPPDESLAVMASPDDVHVEALLTVMLEHPAPPTAIFSGNNRWTVRLLRALRRHRSGADLAFLGFDDFELSEVLDPGISVVAQDAAHMGHVAAELLFRRISGDESAPRRIELQATLIPRGSGELRTT